MHFVQKACERLAAALIVLSGESNQTEAVEDNKSGRPWGFQNRPGAAGYSERHQRSCWVYFKHCTRNNRGLPCTGGVDDTKLGSATRKWSHRLKTSRVTENSQEVQQQTHKRAEMRELNMF